MCGVAIGPTVAIGASGTPEVDAGSLFTSALVGGILGAILGGMLGLLAGASFGSGARPRGSAFVSLVMEAAAFIGMAGIVIGLALLPLFVIVAGALGEDSVVVSCLGAPISLIVTACGLRLISKRAERYAKTFWIPASPARVVKKVVLWGSGSRKTKVTLDETTVMFTHRYRPAAWPILLGALWLFLMVALGVVMSTASTFFIGIALFLVFGALLVFVRTTERLTVTATAIEAGSQVTISGQAVPGLIQQLERLMATSPTGPTPTFSASPEARPSSTNAYGF
jgi:hypothetical protein